MRIPKGKTLGSVIEVIGGPWSKQLVFIPRGGTMLFRVGEWYGHYAGGGGWVNGRP